MKPTTTGAKPSVWLLIRAVGMWLGYLYAILFLTFQEAALARGGRGRPLNGVDVFFMTFLSIVCLIAVGVSIVAYRQNKLNPF